MTIPIAQVIEESDLPNRASAMEDEDRALSRAKVATMTLVVASSTFNAITADAMVSAMPQMTREFGSGVNAAFMAQMILVTPSLSIIVAAPLAGLLVHRFGFKTLMIASLLLYALTGGFGFVAPGSASLIASRVVLGFASGLLSALALSRAADFDLRSGARLLGFANAMAATTAIASFVLGGWLAREFGWRTASLTYLWTLVLVPVVLMSSSMGERKVPLDGAAPAVRFPWLATLPTYLLVLGIFMVVYGSSIEGPFVLSRLGMSDPAQVGVAISASAFLCAVTAFGYGWIARLLDDRLQFVLVFLAFAASTVITSLAASSAVAIVGLSITGVGSGILSPLLVSRLIRKVPPAHVATATGLFGSATFVSVFLTPVAYKLIVDVGGVHVYTGLAAFMGIALLATICMVMTGRLAR